MNNGKLGGVDSFNGVESEIHNYTRLRGAQNSVITGGQFWVVVTICFVAQNDKHREVFAAVFRDRVVHHLLVRHLEKTWEPIFIHDSYACRRGKGTHGAVKRLQSFLRGVTANESRRAWYAQLDVKAFFPSKDRKVLLEIILSRSGDGPQH